MSHAIHRFIFRQCNLHLKVGVTHKLAEWMHECNERMAYLLLPLAKGKYSTAQLFHQSKYQNYGHSRWAFCSELFAERRLFCLALACASSRVRNYVWSTFSFFP